MTRLQTIFLATLGFVVCWGVIQLILQRSLWLGAFRRDHQFHQTHSEPIPRFGGVALAAALIAVTLAAFLWFPEAVADRRETYAVVLGCLGMFLLGVVDDARPIGAKIKLIFQIIVAVLVCTFGGLNIETFKNPFTDQIYQLGNFGLVITIFWLVAVTNLINLVDGLDGLAGGISFMVLCLLAFVGLQMKGSLSLVLAIGMAGALLGFLNFNFPPARIYMGDGGAYLLGFLIGTLGLTTSNKGSVAAALFAPVCALALPIYDVAMAILRRGMRGLPIFRPDKKHIHHRLSQLGLSPTRAVLLLYAFSLLFALLGLSIFWSGGKLAPLAVGFALLMGVVGLRAMARLENWVEVRHLIGTMGDIRRESRHALALSRWFELAAERAATAEEVWRDFQFVIGKLNLGTLTIQVGEVERRWANPAFQSGDDDLSDVHELFLGGPIVLKFSGDSRVMVPKVFFLLSELASEAWLKGARKWHIAKGSPICLAPEPARPLPEAVSV